MYITANDNATGGLLNRNVGDGEGTSDGRTRYEGDKLIVCAVTHQILITICLLKVQERGIIYRGWELHIAGPGCQVTILILVGCQLPIFVNLAFEQAFHSPCAESFCMQ